MTRLVAVLTLFVVATTVFKAARSYSKVCPMQFEYVRSRCLHLQPRKMTHHLAKTYCKSLGAMLVTPRTPYEYRSLIKWLQYQSIRKNWNIWIGLKNIGTGHSDNYVWEDGYNTTLTWSSWAPGWPDSDRGQCVVQSRAGLFGSWVNHNCATPLENVVCQSGTHKDCYLIGHAELYTGTESQTSDGIVCQRWDSQKPHQHHYTHPSFFQDGISHNYCRNKIGEHYNPWCYTIDPNETWGYCNVKECGEETTTTTAEQTTTTKRTTTTTARPTTTTTKRTTTTTPEQTTTAEETTATITEITCDGVNFYFPDVNNKCMFYNCDKFNELFHMRCPAGLMWSQSELDCALPLDPSETCT